MPDSVQQSDDDPTDVPTTLTSFPAPTEDHSFMKWHRFECRVCGELGEWEQEPFGGWTKDSEYETWDVRHSNATNRKHASFWHWQTSRSSSRVYWMLDGGLTSRTDRRTRG